jgi:hypothetical protein
MGFGFTFNETIVKIEILKLGNNSYSSLWFLSNFTIWNLFGKNHFRVWTSKSKVYDLIISNKEVLIELTFLKLLRFYLVFENFVWIILVGFKFKIKLLLKLVFKFGSTLFHTSMQYYKLNR